MLRGIIFFFTFSYCLASLAQSDTLYFQDFEDSSYRSEITILNNDSFEIYEGYKTQFPDNTWEIWYSNNNHSLANSSFFLSENARCEDWLILPKISTNQENLYLKWKQKSIDKNNLESLSIHVIFDDTIYYSLDSFLNISNSWNEQELEIPMDSTEVKIAFKHNSKNKQILLIDDLLIYKKDSIDIQINNSSLPKINEATKMEVNIEIQNNGYKTLDSCYLTFIANNDTIVNHYLTTALNLSKSATTNIKLPGFWNPLNGAYNTQLICSTPLDSTRTNNILFDTILIYNEYYDRVSLIESFTAINCNPCQHFLPVINEEINLSVQSIGITYPTYHQDDDSLYLLDQENFDWRFRKHKDNHLPFSVINGTTSQHPFQMEAAAYHLRSSSASFIDIQLSTSRIDTIQTDFDVTISIDSIDTIDTKNLVCYAVIIEKELTFHQALGSNGQKEFSYIVRKLLPDSNGHSLSNIDWSFNYIIDTNYIQNAQNLSIIAWVEDTTTGEIIQANEISEPLFYQSIPEINNQQIKVYPSISNQFINIVGHQERSLLSLYNIQGQKLLTREIDPIKTKIDLHKTPNGFYFISISTNQKQHLFKIQIIH